MEVYTDLLDYISLTIVDKISAHSPVSEKMLMDLSLIIDRLIHEDKNIDLSPSCIKMFEVIDCFWYYWIYSEYKDDDLEIILSYTRVYQIVCMYRLYWGNKSYKDTVQRDAIRYKDQKKLIQVLHDKPGLPFETLCQILEVSPSRSFKKLLETLIEEGYIYTNRPGNYTWYSLSKKGLDLYKLLCK